MKFFIVVYHLGIAAWQTTPKLSGLKQQILIISHVSVGRLMLPMIWAVFVRILRQPSLFSWSLVHTPPSSSKLFNGKQALGPVFLFATSPLTIISPSPGCSATLDSFQVLKLPKLLLSQGLYIILPTARGRSLRPAASSGNTLLMALELHQLWSPPTSDFSRFLCPQLLWTGGFCFPFPALSQVRWMSTHLGVNLIKVYLFHQIESFEKQRLMFVSIYFCTPGTKWHSIQICQIRLLLSSF